ncbi:solute carrier family 26 (sodium-independent sulfate anion transporter), member 11 [Geosmithia morbida]|uniref:Solute carrier family 26 (Sodium-independent sulfate anion transporter), member 11 n=1 Tax=Geosmithia morbida TaxID=1094350 RepID=A0A9P4YWS4_9HYPO|nr:solute carrier family 26 (sodium-independent sulfate anion transporter), member 11 [Geosmithia morbida]KAF4124523.1 solute carrier family 26 (sodium-independent sulfate anion transporter), member 11 [Geosmithia morbida]
MATASDQLPATETDPLLPSSVVGKSAQDGGRDDRFKDDGDDDDDRNDDDDDAPLVPLGAYIETDPTVGEWLLRHRPTRRSAVRYVRSLFPFLGWLPRYNTKWFIGDAIGGITLGFVVVPQTMAYALLAGLPPQYGLYTSFVGTSLYWLFGTSKDVAISATAVLSLLVGRVVNTVTAEHPEYRNQDVAECISLVSGLCLLIFGLLRLDWIIELIPLVAISAFVTGASITITLSQLPGVLGITGIRAKESAVSVFLQLVHNIGNARAGDAAVGLSALVFLESIKWYSARMLARPRANDRLWSTVASLRMTLVMCAYTIMSAVVNYGQSQQEAAFRLLGPVPSDLGFPVVDRTLLLSISPHVPAVILVLIVEHIAIAKSFGKINNYVVVPSQEMIATGITNLVGGMFGAYSSTGSFTGTAILSKAGVRTPLAGTFKAAIVMMALYWLTSVFYYIPMAALSGLIVHAVSNLVTSPGELRLFWLISPPDLFIYVVGVSVSVFGNLETGIYATAGLSLVFLLYRVARAEGKFMGRASVSRYVAEPRQQIGPTDRSAAVGGAPRWRDVYLSHERDDGTNPHVKVENPYPGVFIFKLTENLHYLNQAHIVQQVVSHITSRTRRAIRDDPDKTARDRPWNDLGPETSPGETVPSEDNHLPPLHALVLDMSAVNDMDVTSVQGLTDLRHRLEQWASPEKVEFHLANVTNRWTRKALAACGFGQPSSLDGWNPEFTIAELGSSGGGAGPVYNHHHNRQSVLQENGYIRHFIHATSGNGFVELGSDEEGASSPRSRQFGSLIGMDRPHFHADLDTAVQCAARSLGKKRGRTAATTN